MVRLHVQGIEKNFGATRALQHAALSVNAGEIHAILGESGAGRSTLAGILGGAFRPDAGAMLLDAASYAPSDPREARMSGVAMVCQERTLLPDLSVVENIVLGIEPAHGAGWLDRKRERTIARRTLAELDAGAIPLDAAAGSLSPAEQQQVEIARALASNPKALVMDEPVSALSHAQREAVFPAMCKLSARGAAIVYVAGQYEEAQAFCHHYTVLRDGRTVEMGAMSCLDRAHAFELITGRSALQAYPHPLHYVGKPVLHLAANRAGLLEVDFTLHEGEIVGLAGLVGAGRARLLRLLFGMEPIRRGSLWFRGKLLARRGEASRLRAGIAIMGRERDEFLPNRSIAENLALMRLGTMGNFGLISDDRLRLSGRDWMEKLHVWAAGPTLEIGRLSRSQQQKIALGRLVQNPRVDRGTVLRRKGDRRCRFRRIRAPWNLRYRRSDAPRTPGRHPPGVALDRTRDPGNRRHMNLNRR